jgi:hypothetical protein
MALALGGGAKIAVADYCLRHGRSDGYGRLRHWELEASLDGLAWATLRSRRQSLADAAFLKAAWAVEGGQGRVLSLPHPPDGREQQWDDGLFCAGVELYGVLHPTQQ